MHLHRPQVSGLAIPALTLAVAAVAFTSLADSAAEGDGLARLDPSLTTDIVHGRTSILTAAARTLTFAGSEVVVGILALGLVIVLLERRGPRPAIIATIAMGVSAALTVGVKLAVGRPRPGAVDRLGPFDSTYSFPSGHTLNSAVLLGVTCLLLVPVLRRRSLRIVVDGGALVLAAGVGASRVYLGYHWATDVLASWAIAAALLSIVLVADRVSSPAEQSGGGQVQRATVDS